MALVRGQVVVFVEGQVVASFRGQVMDFVRGQVVAFVRVLIGTTNPTVAAFCHFGKISIIFLKNCRLFKFYSKLFFSKNFIALFGSIRIYAGNFTFAVRGA